MIRTPADSRKGGLLAPIIRGVVHAIFLSIILSLLVGIIFYFSNLYVSYGPPISSAILVLSAFWGGMIAAKSKKSHGLLVGLAVGATYIFLLAIFSLVFFKGQFSLFGTTTKLLLCLFAGGLGGILGIIKN
jgi:putative membrane protein (TIGR04086 family)